MSATKNYRRKAIHFIALTLTLIMIFHFSREQLLKKQTMFIRAYSYIIVNNKKTTICFDDTLNIIIKLKAYSVGQCIHKCQGATTYNLRGINFVKSLKSCSCLPKMDVWYNVTNVTNGCVSFVTHSCPSQFDYVIENHKCYKFQDALLLWNPARSLCNNYSSSHIVVIDHFLENEALRQYSLAILNNASYPAVYKFFIDHGYYGTWLSAYRFYNISNYTPFLWSPYPSQFMPIANESFRWTITEPNEPYFPTYNICVTYGVNEPDSGWEDLSCGDFKIGVLCELDIPM